MHKILCIKLVNYWDKNTGMHGQQNIKKKKFKEMVEWNTKEHNPVLWQVIFEYLQKYAASESSKIFYKKHILTMDFIKMSNGTHSDFILRW